MKKLLLLALVAACAWGQRGSSTPNTLTVLRLYNLTASSQYVDERASNRQANYHSFCATGTGTWAVQMEYADASYLGPWTSFGSTALVTNGSTNCVGNALGYHAFIRLNTTVGATSSTYTSWKDAYVSVGVSGGSGGATITPTTNVIRGDGAGNGVSAGFAATGLGIASLFSGCSGTQYLGADGACHTPPGIGTVTSVGLVGTTNQITVTGSNPITSSGSWTLSFPSGGVTLPGTTTGSFTGNLTGNTSGTAATITGALALANTPLTTRGDLMYANATPALTRLGVGANGTCLTSNGLIPVWASCPAGMGTIATTSNVLKGDGAGNAISAGYAGTGAGIVTLFSGCSGTQYLGADAACHDASGSGTVTSVGVSRTNDTNVTLTLGGTNPITTSGTISVAAGWTGTLAAGRLNASVVQGVTNDTNVTGAIATQNLTLGWTGVLAAARLNSNVVQSFINDTNVTASISAQVATLGWTGTLAAGRLNANVVQAVTNDTNIHGAISAQNLTFSWAGTLAAARLNSSVVQAVTNDTNITGAISAQNLTLGWAGTLAGARMTTMAGDAGSGGVKGAVPAPAAGDAAAGKFLKADGTWTTPAGAGTVTVVGGGNLGSTALVTGGGVTTVQTPNTSATLDASGNISTPGTIRTGVGTGLAGFSDFGAGTAHTATGVGFQAPVSIGTPYMMTPPGSPSTGFMLNTGTSDPTVITFIGFTGTGNVVRATSPTLVTPALGTPSALVLTNATALPAAQLSVGALANGMTGTTQMVGDNTTKLATDAFVLANAGSTSNACTDNPTAGALGATNTANHTYCLTGAYTSATASTISAANVTIQCTKGTTITFTGATTDGFDLTGDDDTIRGCTLDGNSTQTKPIIVVSGNRATIEYNTFQNMGVTSPALANIYVNSGKGHRIRNNYWPFIADQIIYVGNDSTATTISDVIVENNYIASFNPGSAALNGFYAKSVIMSNKIVTGVRWLNNTMYCQGANANCMAHNMDISPTGEGPGNHSWVGNKVILAGAVADAFHLFGNYHNDISGDSVMNDDGSTFAVSKYFSFGDSYYSNYSNLVIKNPAGFYTGDFVWADLAYNVIEGLIADGGTGNSATAGCFYLFSVAGVNSHNRLSNLTCDIRGAFASPGLRIESGTASFDTLDNHIAGLHVNGTGTAGQSCVDLVETTGTMANTSLTDIYCSNLPTGISVGSGVANTKIGESYFETVTAQVADSGTGTYGVSHTVRGTCVLGTSCVVTMAQGGFSTSTSYQCTATDQTAAAAVKVVNTSATVVTFTGTGTDTLAYICGGF